MNSQLELPGSEGARPTNQTLVEQASPSDIGPRPQSSASNTLNGDKPHCEKPEEDTDSPPHPLTILQRIWVATKPLANPPSVALIFSIVIANVQPLKALFVHTATFSLKDAPDDKPPLDFLMEITSFAGPAVPVLGLTLLGAALSRLTLKGLPKGFWKAVLCMAILKLIVCKPSISANQIFFR